MLAFGALGRAAPDHLPVVGADAFAFVQLRVARLVQAHDHIHALALAGDDERIGAEGAVGQQDVARAQVLEYLPGQTRIVRLGPAFDGGQPRASPPIQAAEQCQPGDTQARLVMGRARGGVSLHRAPR